MQVAIFYHCWADGEWEAPTGEFLTALQEAHLTQPVRFGIVGSKANRAAVRAYLKRRGGLYSVVAEQDEGYEQVTLAEVHKYAQSHAGAVMYAHTKGAAYPGPLQDAWRQSMTYKLVRYWEHNLKLLTTTYGSYDAVGCHWLTPRDSPTVEGPKFGGNFWIASCRYLRKLPEPSPDTERHEAETWIGLANPRIRDLKPGWPTMQAFVYS